MKWTETGATKRRIRILLVDDHPKVRQGLTVLLKGLPDIEIAGEASDGSEAVRLAKELLPDVITMDVYMPVMNGIEATRKIHSELPQIQVLALSMSVDAEDAMRSAGAVGYVVKTASPDLIIESIRNCIPAIGTESDSIPIPTLSAE